MRKIVILLAVTLCILGLVALWLFTGSKTKDSGEVSSGETDKSKASGPKRGASGADVRSEQENTGAPSRHDGETKNGNNASSNTDSMGGSTAQQRKTRDNPNDSGTEGSTRQGQTGTSAGTGAKSPEDKEKKPARSMLHAPYDEPADGDADRGTALASASWSNERLIRRFRNMSEDAPDAEVREFRGKIMSSEHSSGLGNARVLLHTFVYPGGTTAGLVIPLLTEGFTKADGTFVLNAPLTRVHIRDHPRAAITVWADEETLTRTGDALGVRSARAVLAGHDLGAVALDEPVVNTGIVWTIGRPFEVTCNGHELGVQEYTAHFCGQVNPSLWIASSRVEALAAFPSASLTLKDKKFEKVPMEVNWPTYGAAWFAAVTANGFAASAPVGGHVMGIGSGPQGNISPHKVTWTVTFETDGDNLSGQVFDQQGYGLDGAVLTFHATRRTLKAITAAGGWYTLTSLPSDLAYVMVEHPQWVTRRIDATAIERPITNITLNHRRPDFSIAVTELGSGLAIKNVRLTITEWPPGDHDPEQGFFMHTRNLEMANDQGIFRVQGDKRIEKLTVSALGYAAQGVPVPTDNPPSPLLVSLKPTRRLEIRPDSFAAQRVNPDHLWNFDGQPVRWFKASASTSEADSDDIYTYWDHIWLDYRIDLNQGQGDGAFEAADFDLVVGCRNETGQTNNKYSYELEVSVNGVSKGKVQVLADPLNERTGTISLGKLSGVQTIRLTWVNDQFIKDELDTNLRITSLKLIER